MKSAKIDNVVVAQMDAIRESDEGDEGEIGRVWYCLEEVEIGVGERKIVVMEMRWKGVDQLGESCPLTRFWPVGERVEESRVGGDAAGVEVVELVWDAREGGYAEEGEGRDGVGHSELAV